MAMIITKMCKGYSKVLRRSENDFGSAISLTCFKCLVLFVGISLDSYIRILNRFVGIVDVSEKKCCYLSVGVGLV